MTFSLPGVVNNVTADTMTVLARAIAERLDEQNPVALAGRPEPWPHRRPGGPGARSGLVCAHQGQGPSDNGRHGREAGTAKKRNRKNIYSPMETGHRGPELALDRGAPVCYNQLVRPPQPSQQMGPHYSFGIAYEPPLCLSSFVGPLHCIRG